MLTFQKFVNKSTWTITTLEYEPISSIQLLNKTDNTLKSNSGGKSTDKHVKVISFINHKNVINFVPDSPNDFILDMLALLRCGS